MDSDDPKIDFTAVIDSVMSMFGQVMSLEAISAIVEHCGGDLNQSIDAIMNMSEDGGHQQEDINSHLTTPDQTNQPTIIPITPPINVPLNNVNQHNVAQMLNTPITSAVATSPQSYSAASQNKARFSKQLPKPTPKTLCKWDLQIKQIIEYHNQGYKIMIIMRGVPGSGKSHLAKQLVRTMCPGVEDKTHIFSSDDYFMVRGQYRYDKNRLPEAHDWNHNRVQLFAARGLSPIFVDNTHVQVWEMEPYVKFGICHGYIIEVLEPDTPWAKKAHQCVSKNTHNVPQYAIRRMLDNFEYISSGTSLIRMLGLSYSADRVPPKMRNYPPITHQQHLAPDENTCTSSQPPDNVTIHTNVDTVTILNQPQKVHQVIQSQNALHQVFNSFQNQNTTGDITYSTDVQNHQELASNIAATTSSSTEENVLASEEKSKASGGDNPPKEPEAVDVPFSTEKIKTLRKKFDVIERVDADWDNGEKWDETSGLKPSRKLESKAPLFSPQQPRSSKAGRIASETILSSALACNDWSQMSMYLPKWDDLEPPNPQVTPNIPIETASVSTSVEYGDTDTNTKNFKVLFGTPKDINLYYMGPNKEKIPDKRMLDKSSMTNDHDHLATKTFRCHNEERHFDMVTNMFPSISRDYLRDVFDNCQGDVNWAVNIIFDSVKDEPVIIPSINPDMEQSNEEPCDCLAAYNIIPNVNTQPVFETVDAVQVTPEIVAGPSTSKMKKEKTVLESSLLLKRQIEKNVVISDNHYSQHCLKLRKLRRGEVNDGSSDTAQNETEESSAPATSKADTVTNSTVSYDEDDSNTSCSDDCERTVNVDLGPVFVSELDEMFGRNDMYYPENLVTRVNMPVSLLDEINALWMESFMYQFEQQSRQSELMLRQDEEFARQLALKEEELARAGQEPVIPDLKEIMDMELALSIYKKEITAEWRSNVPNDLAARMTREKLCNLFPDVMPDTLSELLMAHDNNFNATVEVLLSSTGNAQILEEENGVARFIATKELERQKKILEEEKKALSEVEWPLLNKEVKVDMKMVEDYRAQASQSLAQRNLYYLKAQEFFKRDMTPVATYYSEVAGMHKRRFDLANNLAAASLMQVHASNSTDNATIDLHFLHVPEAKETLDLFLDTHIQKLRELQSKGPPIRFHNLFFITGRGLHSHGGPKIKPAVKRRLRERGIAFSERNPGLLASKVCSEDKMTFELP